MKLYDSPASLGRKGHLLEKVSGVSSIFLRSSPLVTIQCPPLCGVQTSPCSPGDCNAVHASCRPSAMRGGLNMSKSTTRSAGTLSGSASPCSRNSVLMGCSFMVSSVPTRSRLAHAKEDGTIWILDPDVANWRVARGTLTQSTPPKPLFECASPPVGSGVKPFIRSSTTDASTCPLTGVGVESVTITRGWSTGSANELGERGSSPKTGGDVPAVV